MSNERFIKFITSEESEYLQENYPNAFLLLCLIARRARRLGGHPDGLEIGEAHIGDFNKAGIETRGQYRQALDILIKRAHIKKVETCRTRQKTTTGTTTKGTKVKLLRSDVWDINSEDNNHRNDQRATTEQPPSNHEQERTRKKKKEKKVNTPPIFLIERRKDVSTSEEDHNKLVEKYGIDFVNEAYDFLDNWKSSQTEEKKNECTDIGRLRNWAINAFKKKKIEEAELEQRERRLKSFEKTIPNGNDVEKNKEFIKKIEREQSSLYCRIDIAPKGVEFTPLAGNRPPECFAYDSKTFQQEVEHQLSKNRFKFKTGNSP